MAEITYGDKSQGQSSGFPTNQKWTHQDANEVKSVVNANQAQTDVNTANVATNTSSINNLDFSGWGFYVDAESTPVTQTITSTASLLQIDGGGGTTEESYLPKEIRGNLFLVGRC
jgi:hypothetical protein